MKLTNKLSLIPVPIFYLITGNMPFYRFVLTSQNWFLKCSEFELNNFFQLHIVCMNFQIHISWAKTQTYVQLTKLLIRDAHYMASI